MNPAIRILDVVALAKDIPGSGLVRGHVGTVIEQLDVDTYEVEFIDNNGKTYRLAALNAGELMVLRHGPTGAG